MKRGHKVQLEDIVAILGAEDRETVRLWIDWMAEPRSLPMPQGTWRRVNRLLSKWEACAGLVFSAAELRMMRTELEYANGQAILCGMD